MRKNFSSQVLLLTLFIVSGCSKHQELRNVVWTSSQKTPPPAIVTSTNFKQEEISLLSKDELTERALQRIGHAEVEQSFLQKVSNTKGELLYVKAAYTEKDYSSLLPKIEKAYADRFLVLEKLKRSDKDLAKASEISSPDVMISDTGDILYRIDYVDQTKLGAYRIKVSKRLGIVSQHRVGSNFDTGKGFVFPNGPKLSSITEEILSELTGDGTLTKSGLKVMAQTPEIAKSSDLTFKYDPTDVRFDQVQVFYFTDKVMQLFNSKLGLKLPFALEVQTHIGSPDKTNAAFYYHGQIRLGTGDGVSYANIMKDPTIVMHETCHAYIDALARLPYEGEGGSINEGMADFFTTAFLENPKLGEVSYLKAPFKRTVLNELKVSDKQGKLYFDSGIVSGTFWEIKEILGQAKTIELAVKTLSRLGPNGTFKDFGSAIDNAVNSNSFKDDEIKSVQTILRKRQWLL